jgi:hypothetical protein
VAWFPGSTGSEVKTLKKGIGLLLADELRRALDEYDRVDAEQSRLLEVRRQRAVSASRLVQILRAQVGPRSCDRTISELGLADRLARLPVGLARATARVTGTAGSIGASRTGGRVPVSAADVLPRGTPVRLLAGKFAGRSGTIGYTQVKRSSAVYTLILEGGKRTQVTSRSRGATWDVVGQGIDGGVGGAPPRPARILRRRRNGEGAATHVEVRPISRGPSAAGRTCP